MAEETKQPLGPTNSTDDEPKDQKPIYYRAKLDNVEDEQGNTLAGWYKELKAGKAEKDHTHLSDDITETKDKQFVSYGDIERWDVGPLYNKDIPTWIGHGGVNKGTTFINATTQQMFDNILYPDMPPIITNATISYTKVHGNHIEEGAIGSCISATCSVDKTTRAIAKISLMRNSTVIVELSGDDIADGGTFILTPTDNNTFTGSCTHKIRVTDSGGYYADHVFDAIEGVMPIYYGSFNTNSIIASQATQLSKSIAGRSNQTIKMSSTNCPLFICYPDLYGNVSKIYDSSGHDLTNVLNTYTINISGTMYRVYQSERVTVQNLEICITW